MERYRPCASSPHHAETCQPRGHGPGQASAGFRVARRTVRHSRTRSVLCPSRLGAPPTCAPSAMRRRRDHSLTTPCTLAPRRTITSPGRAPAVRGPGCPGRARRVPATPTRAVVSTPRTALERRPVDAGSSAIPGGAGVVVAGAGHRRYGAGGGVCRAGHLHAESRTAPPEADLGKSCSRPSASWVLCWRTGRSPACGCSRHTPTSVPHGPRFT